MDVKNRTEEYVERMSSDRGARNYLDALKTLVYDPVDVFITEWDDPRDFHPVPTMKGRKVKVKLEDASDVYLVPTMKGTKTCAAMSPVLQGEGKVCIKWKFVIPQHFQGLTV